MHKLVLFVTYITVQQEQSKDLHLVYKKQLVCTGTTLNLFGTLVFYNYCQNQIKETTLS